MIKNTVISSMKKRVEALMNLTNRVVFGRSNSAIFNSRKNELDFIDNQDLSRFSEQDIILETEDDIQKYLPDVLGQALARTWIDKRFLDAFFKYPVEILERGGVYLPETIQLEFVKEEKRRPKVTVFEKTRSGRKKILELKLIMVAEQ